MTIKREAAFHEAGHAVVAYLSKFHGLLGNVNLGEYGSGSASVSLSKRKLIAAGKSPTSASASDKEVATDMAIILCAGLVSERIAAEKDPAMLPDEECAEPDYDLMKQLLLQAGLPRHFDRHEESARAILISNWNLVTIVAARLFSATQLDSLELVDIIEMAR